MVLGAEVKPSGAPQGDSAPPPPGSWLACAPPLLGLRLPSQLLLPGCAISLLVSLTRARRVVLGACLDHTGTLISKSFA